MHIQSYHTHSQTNTKHIHTTQINTHTDCLYHRDHRNMPHMLRSQVHTHIHTHTAPHTSSHEFKHTPLETHTPCMHIYTHKCTTNIKTDHRHTDTQVHTYTPHTNRYT